MREEVVEGGAARQLNTVAPSTVGVEFVEEVPASSLVRRPEQNDAAVAELT